MKLLTLPLIFILLLLTACATQPVKVTDTRWPQAVIAAPKSELHNKFVSLLAQAGASITDISPSMIKSRGPVSNPALTKAFFGCASCGDPYVEINVILSAVPKGTLTVMQYWRMVPQYNGSVKRMAMDSSAIFNKMQKMLWQARDHYTNE